MTDTTFAPQAAPAPAPAASHETSATPTPVTTETPAAEPTDWDREWQEFLGHDLRDEPTSSPEPTPAASPSSPAAPTGVAVPVAPVGAPVSPSPVQANGGTPPAIAGHEGTSPEVDPNLLFAVLGGQPVTPAAAPQPTPAMPEPAPSSPEGPWEPFQPNFQLPAAVTDAIFRSEDPQQQSTALVNLLSSFGNAVAQVMEQRITAVHAPRMQEQFTNATVERQQAAAVNQDFYSNHADLKPFSQIVRKAGEVFFQKNPQATYTAETRNQIAALARTAAKQLGYNVGQPAAAPVAVAPGNAAPALFVAGAARPESLGLPENTDSPAGIFDQLNDFF